MQCGLVAIFFHTRACLPYFGLAPLVVLFPGLEAGIPMKLLPALSFNYTNDTEARHVVFIILNVTI